MKKKIFYEYDVITRTSIGVEYEKYLHQSQSKYQKIEVIKTERYGNAMYLDGCFMLSEKNQDFYHDKCKYLTPQTAKKILIIGGGDHALASMISKNSIVSEIDVVEIDNDVVTVSKRYFPKYFKHSKEVKGKINLVIQDGMQYLKDNEKKYDCIIIDSTDPVDNAKVLFSKLFIMRCYNSLTSRGLLIQQSGSPIKDIKHVINPLKRKCKEVGFERIELHTFPMPLYPSGTWSFLTAKRA